jgi:hypothetical protein
MATERKAKAPANVRVANIGSFAERIGELERHFGSVAEIARRCGSSETAVRKWMAGAEPSRDRCIALARGTGVSLMWLVAGAPPMWAKDQSPHERDTQLIALGDPESPEVREACRRRDQAIKDWSAGLATGLASQQPSQPLRRNDLIMALQLASEALGDKELPPAKHAELVTLIYELLEEGLPEAKVLRFARAAA